MASRPPTPGKPARKRASKAAPAQPAADSAAPQAPEDLLRAGLKAFRLESLLGLMPPKAAQPPAVPGLGFGGLDSFGFRKFEDVFDQRVGAALRRMGWPGPEEFQALQAEVTQLKAELAALRRPTPAPASRPPARGKR